MRIWQWLVENFMNGELFFYIIPIFLLIVLVIVIRLPDNEDERDPGEKKPDDKKPSRVPRDTPRHDTIDLTLPTESGTDVEVYYKKDPDSPPAATVAEAKAQEGVAVEVEAPAAPAPELPPAAPKNYDEGLEKTRGGFFARLKNIFTASAVTDELIEEMEEILYSADLGVATVAYLMGEVRANRASLQSGDAVRELLKARIRVILKSVEKPFTVGAARPFVILMVGVNGAGKTTTIGKLAKKFTTQGHGVVMAAADTFRAAAVEQLAEWGARAGADVISDREGADPASVAFNAVNAAVSGGKEIVIVDTAGRLQNRVNLMEELRKVHRVIGKASAGAPHETLLVIDANNGQNAVSQAREFGEAVAITGIIVTKLDGTAKGGSLIGIARELALPVYFAGIGESVADLRPFDADGFTEALFK